MITSRGCPFKCTFCARIDKSYRVRSVTSVVDEMEFLREERDVKEIHVLDDIFNLDIKRAKAICDEIIRRRLDISWALPSGIRVNRKLIDEELARKLHKSGCWMVAFGIESGSQKILNRIHKNLTLNEVRRAVKICRDAGIEELWGFFLIGLPGETKGSIKQTIDFACELDLNVAKFLITVPFPGSELYTLYKNKGFLKTEDFSLYGIHLNPVIEFPELSAIELIEMKKLAYKRFYLTKCNLFKHIKQGIKSPTYMLKRFKAACLLLNYTLF
jgi:radical SAM superfamily enzyme YgiQ (UPF0313 family)